jgi:hypothetical protein
MPDSDWSTVPNPQQGAIEQRHVQGRPPEDGFVRRERGETVDRRPNGAQIRKQYEIWISETTQPPPVDVYEMCSKCGQHVHRREGPIPAGASTHVPSEHFGERFGLVYQNARVTGKEYRRTLHIFLRADGSELRRIPLWEVRTLDHAIDGIVWLTEMTRYPCVREDLLDHPWLFPGRRPAKPEPPEPAEPV